MYNTNTFHVIGITIYYNDDLKKKWQQLKEWNMIAWCSYSAEWTLCEKNITECFKYCFITVYITG